MILVTLVLAGCTGYGSDSSTLADLLEHHALGIEMNYRSDDDTLLVRLLNATETGACAGIANRLTAKLNGTSGQLFEGVREKSGPDASPEVCPSLTFSHVGQLGDPLLLVLEDGGRAVGDPSRASTVVAHNLSGRVLLPKDTHMDGAGALHATARDRLQYDLPADEHVDSIAYAVTSPGSATVNGDAQLDPTGFSVPIGHLTTGTAAWLSIFAFTTANVESCDRADCTLSIYRYIDGALDIDLP